jgi:DNA polymerase-3 subunit beta
MRVIAQAGAIGSALTLAAAARQRDALVSIVADESAALVCTNPGISIKAAVTAEIVERGTATVSGDRLGELIAGFKPGATINIGTTGNAVTIEQYRLPTADMPISPELIGEIGRVEIGAEDCLDLLAVVSAAGTEPTRFYLTGVFLHSVGDQLVAVASDGTRLIRRSIAAARFSDDATLIVPNKAASALAKLIRQTKTNRITLRRSRAMISASGAGFELVSRLIDGKYPDYGRIVPAPSPNSADIDRAELQAALARLMAIASGDFPLIALAWSEGMPLHVFLPRQPGDGADDVTADTAGSARIALAPSQLTAMLAAFNTKNVCLNAADRLLITAENQLGLLMPCAWNFGEAEKLKTEKRSALDR